MENFPSALVIASYDSVCHNNNVLYRLVRPLPDGSGVQSTDRLVNVVPFRRTYTFERKQQLVDFGQQILRRPLVLQPLLHFGRGLGNYCAACYHDELWLVMVNQTHPKILSRLQMGLDSAKAALERGQPFEIRFRFGKIIQRVYQEHLAQKEREEAQASKNAILQYLTYFRYAEWEYCDLNLRYLGHGAALNRASAFQSLPNLEKWDFEDIGMHEMIWNQFNEKDYTFPHLSSVSEDEIRLILPGWTVNGVSPLENIGDRVPEYNYNYAQAGRLYASFRKKRQSQSSSHQKVVSDYSSQSDDSNTEPYQEDDYDEELVGAVGFEPAIDHDIQYQNINKFKSSSQSWNTSQQKDVSGYSSQSNHFNNEQYQEDDNDEEPVGAVGFKSASHTVYVDSDNVVIEHNMYQNINKSKPSSQSRYQVPGSSHDPKPNHSEINQAGSNLPEHSLYETQVSISSQRRNDAHIAQIHSSEKRHQKGSDVTIQQPDRYGHIYSNIDTRSHKIQPHHYEIQHSIHTNQNAELDVKSSHMHDHLNSGLLKKQDSDRSSRSTIADSGYCHEGDSDRSHGGSYDYNEQNNMSKLKHSDREYVNFPTRNITDDGGLVNPVFNDTDQVVDHVLQQHTQYVSKIIKDEQNKSKPQRPTDTSLNNKNTRTISSIFQNDSVGNIMKAPPRQKRLATVKTTPQVAESYI